MAGLFRSLKSSVRTTIAEKRADPKPEGFTKAAKPQDLFTPTSAEADGEECLHDCSTCTIKYPRKWSVDEDEPVYGFVNGWSTHMLVATGKADWVRDVSDEPGSVMEAVRDSKAPTNGKMMLSASNIPMPNHATSHSEGTSVLLLPAFQWVDKVTPALVPELLSTIVSAAPTNDSFPSPPATPSETEAHPSLSTLQTRPCTHSALILLCSQGTRDARCGQSAPLLRRELERHLRPLGLHRDLDDDRPGGVGVYFISHVGGHKYAANVMVYRRDEASGQAGQCIWLARVRPEDCENLVRYTVLQGKVVKGASQLRGGFDREKGLVSW